MTISEIQLFNALKQKLGEAQAEHLVDFVKTEVKVELQQKTEHLATKEDLAKVGGGLEAKIAQTETKIILWAFVFWATQIGAMFAFLKYFIEK